MKLLEAVAGGGGGGGNGVQKTASDQAELDKDCVRYRVKASILAEKKL